jgi:fatty-acid desaturase
MFKSISKYSWFGFVPFLIGGLTTVIFLFNKTIDPVYLFATVIGWVLISGLGIAVGYHRVFAHNTHPNLPIWKENLLLFLGALGGQGSSITWATIHRGYHHRWSDTSKDLHSPRRGLYHAFFGWTTKITENNPQINFKYAANLLRKPNHLWFHRHQLTILWATPLLISIIDWKLSLTLIVLPVSMSLLQDNLVNIFGHLKCGIGYRNWNTSDNSQNNMILGYFGWGQGWHNNHHYQPQCYDFGSGISGKWWEIDPCRIFLIFLGPSDKRTSNEARSQILDYK